MLVRGARTTLVELNSPCWREASPLVEWLRPDLPGVEEVCLCKLHNCSSKLQGTILSKEEPYAYKYIHLQCLLEVHELALLPHKLLQLSCSIPWFRSCMGIHGCEWKARGERKGCGGSRLIFSFKSHLSLFCWRRYCSFKPFSSKSRPRAIEKAQWRKPVAANNAY